MPDRRQRERGETAAAAANESPARIGVRLLFFGAARDAAAGRDEVELTINAPATVASAFAEISSPASA